MIKIPVKEKADTRLDASLFVSLRWAKTNWNLNVEPDYEEIRKNLQEEWGAVFSKKLPYFEMCMEKFREWKIIKSISYDFSESVEYIDTNLLRTLGVSFTVGDKFNQIVSIRGREGADQWLQKMLDRIAADLSPDVPLVSFNKNSIDDDIWEPLQIDRSTPEYEETIAGIEKAIQEIATDNGFSSTFPDERDNIVEHAKTTIKSVKDGKATKRQIKQNLIAAGKWVMQKFTGSALGAAGKALMDWGLKLFI